MSEILAYLEKRKFRLLNMQLGNWKRRSFEKFPLSRGSPVWAEILMFREIEDFDIENIKKAAVLATAYGFPNLAYSMLIDAGIRFDQVSFLRDFNGIRIFGKTILRIDWPKLH